MITQFASTRRGRMGWRSDRHDRRETGQEGQMMTKQAMPETNQTRAKAVRFTALLLLGMGGVGAVTVQTAARREPEKPAAKKPANAGAAAPQVTVETVSARVFNHPIRVT